jgi:hypothetical protein
MTYIITAAFGTPVSASFGVPFICRFTNAVRALPGADQAEAMQRRLCCSHVVPFWRAAKICKKCQSSEPRPIRTVGNFGFVLHLRFAPSFYAGLPQPPLLIALRGVHEIISTPLRSLTRSIAIE